MPRGNRTLPDTVPLFPLPGAVLLPRTRLPLHIFEPRYLQMLDDALRSGERLIGMIQPEGDGLSAIGCAGRVVAFSETGDGRMMISLRAISRFRLVEVIEGFTPYLRGRVDWSPFKADRAPSVPPDQDFDRPAFLERLQRYMAERELSTDWNAAEEADGRCASPSARSVSPSEPSTLSTTTFCPSRTSPASSMRARRSPISRWTRRRSGRAP